MCARNVMVFGIQSLILMLPMAPIYFHEPLSELGSVC